MGCGTCSGYPALGSVTLKSLYPVPARKGPGLPSRTLVSAVGTQERVVEGVNDQAQADSNFWAR